MKLWTPELASGGQLYPCAKCGLPPSPEGQDGCLGTLVDNRNRGIANSCCGHGDNNLAYVQYNNGVRIGGGRAAKLQKELLCSNVLDADSE